MLNTALAFGIAVCLSGAAYAILMGIFTRGWQRLKHQDLQPGRPPGTGVSILIPARDEENSITGLLNDLVNQDYRKDLMEVIVIDDHSTDRTAELVERFIAENKPHGFRLIRNKDFGGSGKKDAITNGVNESSGELILCTDADCRPGPAWVSSAINYFSDEATLMVFGPVSYFERQGIINKFQSLEFLGLIATGAGAAGAGHPFICNGANLCYRKEAFRQVGGFMGNEKFRTGDDVFLMHKIKKEYGRNSIRFVLDKRLLVLTSPANGLVPFLNQRIRWASKSRGFRDRVSVIAVLTAFAFNLVLTALFLAGFFRPHFFLWFALALIFKSLTELTLILGITGFTGSRKLMKWFLPFQVAYPFYVIAAGIFSLFWGKRW